MKPGDECSTIVQSDNLIQRGDTGVWVKNGKSEMIRGVGFKNGKSEMVQRGSLMRV